MITNDLCKATVPVFIPTENVVQNLAVLSGDRGRVLVGMLAFDLPMAFSVVDQGSWLRCVEAVIFLQALNV